jgi:DNA-binding IclR family transcriptional regulator
VGTVVQAIAVLRHLGAGDAPQGVTAIAAHLGLSPSSCFNILKTLTAEGLARFDPVSKTYSLGAATVDLARQALGRGALNRLARPTMIEFAEKHDCAVGLWRLVGRDRLMLTELAESETATRIYLTVGHRQPLATGATGRAMIAAGAIKEEAVEAAFAEVHWQNPPTLRDYANDVRDARERGWSLDVDQVVRGVTSVAATIPGGDKEAQFCLSASFFTGRSKAVMATMGKELQAAAGTLSAFA